MTEEEREIMQVHMCVGDVGRPCAVRTACVRVCDLYIQLNGSFFNSAPLKIILELPDFKEITCFNIHLKQIKNRLHSLFMNFLTRSLRGDHNIENFMVCQ